MIDRILFIAAALWLSLSISALHAAPPEHASKRIPDHYIIVFKKDVNTDEMANKLLRRFNSLKVNHRYKHALRGISVKMPKHIVSKIADDPAIDYIAPDVMVSINAQVLPTGIDRVNADLDPTANIDGVDDRVDVDIAILDTGIDLDHPDLYVFSKTNCDNVLVRNGPLLVPGCLENDLNANDENGHGTHVAGIAAALDNTAGVVGVAPGARLWAVKVLDIEGNGSGAAIVAGVDYVTEHAADIEVANMSLTGPGAYQPLDDAIDGAVAAGITFILSAGNSHVDVSIEFPAGLPSAITVSAFEDYDGIPGGLSGNAQDDTFAWFSNYGSGVDIMAPGVNIRSTVKGGGIGYNNGTSMAAPHVAGAAALYLSLNPGASPATVKSYLIANGDPAPCNTIDGLCGTSEDLDGIQEPLLLLSCQDSDLDGVCNDIDNCPIDSNPLQTDTDADNSGDACDDDDDNDGLLDTFETTIGSDPLLVDTDGDSLSDFDEVAYDGDALTYNPVTDLNPILADSDNDTIPDNLDPIPLNFNYADGDLAPLGAPDGLINVADYTIGSQIISGVTAVSDLELSHGDLYPVGAPDGVIDLSDLLLIQQLVLQ